MAQIVVNLNRELSNGEEEYGFICESEGFYISEDQFSVDIVDTETTPCPNCAENGLMPVKIVQRSE